MAGARSSSATPAPDARRAACRTLALLAAVGASACADPRGTAWRFVFANEADGARAAGVRGVVRLGDCNGEVLFSGWTRGDRAAEAPDVLEPGRYSFTGLAQDEDCVRFASGCLENVDLPHEGTIEITLEPIAASAGCGLGACDDGLCQETCTSPVAEICNGEDDDCDGLADDAGYEPGDNDAGAKLMACPGAIVISELAVAGPDGDSANELVELHGRTSRPIDLGGVELWDGVGDRSTRLATLPPGSTLPAYGYFLLGSAGYAAASSSAPADEVGATWTNRLQAVEGAVGLTAPAALGIDGPLDLVAWGAGDDAPAGEGARIPPFDGGTQQRGSLERKAREASTAASMAAGGADEVCGNGTDTGDNRADFVLRAARDPQNRMDPPEPPCED